MNAKELNRIIKDHKVWLASDGKEGEIQLRNFSSRPVTSSWQGEIKGKTAAGGGRRSERGGIGLSVLEIAKAVKHCVPGCQVWIVV